MNTNITVHPVDRVLSALDRLIDGQPELESAVDFYEELLSVMYQVRPTLDGLMLNKESAQAKLKEGVPLLWGEFGAAAGIGVEPNMELFMTLCRLATEGGNEDGQVLMRAVLEGHLNLKTALEKTLMLDWAALTQLARSLEVTADSLETIARYTLMPIARAYAHAFTQALDFGEWHQGYCPICGAWPILGELRGRDKLRYLRCGCCGAGWKFKRLQCLWCANSKRQELSFLFDSDNPTGRIDVCDYCRGYIKTIITFDPLDAELLVAHDLETMFMDHMAAAKGYKRPRRQPLQ